MYYHCMCIILIVYIRSVATMRILLFNFIGYRDAKALLTPLLVSRTIENILKKKSVQIV